MMRRISVEEVRRAGVTLRPEEAIAIAQQLIAGPAAHATDLSGELTDDPPPADASDTPRFGPPSPANVYLESDGSVSCAACDVTLAPSEIARFLQDILPPETCRVPGSLRYAIARALLEVDAPPFDSVGEFSEALGRYERGDRTGRVVAVLDRARAALARHADESPAPVVDRRHKPPEVFELRRHLRESDARLYDQLLALDAVGAVHAPARRTRNVAVAAGFAIGLTMVGAGQLMRGGRPTASAVPDGVVPIQSATAAATAANDVAGSAGSTGTVQTPTAVDRTAPPAASGNRRTGARAANVVQSRKNSTASRTVRTAPAARSSRGVLDRLHLGWLRRGIVIRNDL